MATDKRIALYPGTFDPLTNGHVNLVQRGVRMFDTVVVAVAADTGKNTLFSLEERVDMVREVFQRTPNVQVEAFSGLLVDYARKRKATILLRGLRAVSDYEYEFQTSLMNHRLNPKIETVFLIADYRWLYISSTIIKTVARLHGDVRGLVPDTVLARLCKRYGSVAPPPPEQ